MDLHNVSMQFEGSRPASTSVDHYTVSPATTTPAVLSPSVPAGGDEALLGADSDDSFGEFDEL